MILGRLKPIEWFLEQNWVQEDGFINDNADNFGIDNKMFGRELELKKVTVEFMGLTLQDINDKTCYKEEWFEYLNEDADDADDEGEDLDEYGYPYR